ncbi:MAG TPA: hypothetical protein VGF86_10280 [Candidatus Tumulicola sp.]|jgi:hypothetical protein
MDVRLVQLLGSFVAARNQYALARLEYALRHPEEPAPPVIDRLPEASERALREDWPRLETQLGDGLAFAAVLERRRRDGGRDDPTARYVQATLQELDQYARAIRWVLTVTET